MNDFKYPVYATFHAEEKLRGILAIFKKNDFLGITHSSHYREEKLYLFIYLFDGVGWYYSHRLYFALRRFTNIL